MHLGIMENVIVKNTEAVECSMCPAGNHETFLDGEKDGAHLSMEAV